MRDWFSAVIDWWGDRSPWFRYGGAGALLLLAAAAFYVGKWQSGATLGAIGLALLLAAGSSDSERKGYRF